jgi:hypothetical protein
MLQQDALFVRAVEVFDSTSAVTGNSVFLQKKDVTYLREYVAHSTGPSGRTYRTRCYRPT